MVGGFAIGGRAPCGATFVNALLPGFLYEVSWAERVPSGEYRLYFFRAVQALQRIIEQELRLIWVASGVWVLPDIGSLLGEALDRAYLKQQPHGFLRLQESYFGVVLTAELVDWLISSCSGEVFFYPGVLDKCSDVTILGDPFSLMCGKHSLLMMPRPGGASFEELSPLRKQIIVRRYAKARACVASDEPCA